MTITTIVDDSRSARLRAQTHGAHERLDQRIMAAAPFRDRARYALFLKVQYLFHCELDALYDHPALAALVPDLIGRRRLSLVIADLHDLDEAVPAAPSAPRFSPGRIDLPEALGWLYVAEGSNLGAAFLLKAAAVIGLDAGFGARHLSGHADGRAQHWRGFKEALDGVALDGDEEARAIAGAENAFLHVRQLVETHLPRD